MGHLLHLTGWRLSFLLLFFCYFFSSSVYCGVADPVKVEGPQKMLVIMVEFPGSASAIPKSRIEEKIKRVDSYVRAVSGGMTWMETTLSGPYLMPGPLTEYSISPFNAQVDRSRVNRLVREALNLAGKDNDISSFKQIWISVGVWTKPGTETGYRMICLSANPGFLNESTSIRFQMKAVPLAGGSTYSGGIIINAENSMLGHVVHDLFHAMGGAVNGERPVPCLYSHYLQSHPPGGVLNYDTFATYVGAWDVMSQHVSNPRLPINLDEPRLNAPGITSFTRIQLGWFRSEQVVVVHPGETQEVTLEPLVGGENALVIMIPKTKRRYILVENRRKIGFDSALPSSGMLVLQVDRSREEGDGTVVVANANPSVPHLKGAAFLPGQGEKLFFEDKSLNVAIAPLEVKESGAMRIVVTTPARIHDYLK